MASYSRFKNTDLILTRDGEPTYGYMNKFNFLKKDKLNKEDIILIEIKNDRSGKPDLISNDLYKSPIFFWILLLFNNVKQPFGWPKTSTTIEAPSPSVVFRELT